MTKVPFSQVPKGHTFRLDFGGPEFVKVAPATGRRTGYRAGK